MAQIRSLVGRQLATVACRVWNADGSSLRGRGRWFHKRLRPPCSRRVLPLVSYEPRPMAASNSSFLMAALRKLSPAQLRQLLLIIQLEACQSKSS